MYNFFKYYLNENYNNNNKFENIIINDLVNNKIQKNEIIKLLDKYNGIELYDIIINNYFIKQMNKIKMFLKLKYNIDMKYKKYDNNNIFISFNDYFLTVYFLDNNLSIKNIKKIYNLFINYNIKTFGPIIAFENKYDIKNFVDEYNKRKGD